MRTRFRIPLFFALFLFSTNILAQTVDLETQVIAYNQGAWDLRRENLDSAFALSDLALKGLSSISDKEVESNILSTRAILLKEIGDFNQSTAFHFRALKLREELNIGAKIASSLNNIGNNYFLLEQPEKALEFHKNAFDYGKNHDDPNLIISGLNNLGNDYKDLGKIDSAILTYQLGIAYCIDDYLIDAADMYLNLGELYNKTDNWDLAISNLNESLALYEKMNDTYGKVMALHNLGIAFEGMKNYPLALEKYNSAFSIGENIIDIELKKDLYQSFLILGLKMNSDSITLSNFISYNELNQLYTEQIIESNIADIETKYQVDKKIALLKIEEEKNARMKAENNQQTITIIALLVLIAVIVVLVVIVLRFYRQKRKLTKLELEAKKNEIEQLMHGYELDLFEAQNFGQQEERQRIAEDLHDRLGGLLAAVNLQIESLMHSKTADNSTELTKVQVMLSEGINEVRNVAHNLRAEALKKHGLKGALESICQSIINSKKLNIDLYLDDLNEKIDPVIEKESYKIIMELLSNTLKHANATLITLQISEIENELTLVYEDNGSGFIQLSNKKEGLGIPSINNRVSKLNGSFQIDSHPHSGTTVIIKIPQI